MNRLSIIVILVCIAVLLSGCSGIGPGATPTAGKAPAPAPATGSLAKINPEFEAYQEDLKAGMVEEKTK